VAVVVATEHRDVTGVLERASVGARVGHVEALRAAVHGELHGRVIRDGRVDQVAGGALDEDGRDGDANVRAGHVDGAGAVVVVDQDSNGASVLGVDRLGGEVADATADQGDLAGHVGGIGETDGGRHAVSFVTDAAVERVGDDHLQCVGGERDVLLRDAVEDGVTGGVHAAGPIQDEVLGGAVGGHVQRVHARERGGETIADHGAIRGELDEHAVGVAVQRAVVDAIPCSVQLRQAVASGVRAVKQVDVVEVCLGVEGGEGDLRDGARGGAGERPHAQHTVVVVAVALGQVTAVCQGDAVPARLRGRGRGRGRGLAGAAVAADAANGALGHGVRTNGGDNRGAGGQVTGSNLGGAVELVVVVEVRRVAERHAAARVGRNLDVPQAQLVDRTRERVVLVRVVVRTDGEPTALVGLVGRPRVLDRARVGGDVGHDHGAVGVHGGLSAVVGDGEVVPGVGQVREERCAGLVGAAATRGVAEVAHRAALRLEGELDAARQGAGGAGAGRILAARLDVPAELGGAVVLGGGDRAGPVGAAGDEAGPHLEGHVLSGERVDHVRAEDGDVCAVGRGRSRVHVELRHEVDAAVVVAGAG